MKTYSIISCVKRSIDGVATDQLLTLEVSYNKAEPTTHGKIIAIDADPAKEAIQFAAELDQVLTEPKVITVEDVPVLKAEIKKEDVDSKVAEIKQAIIDAQVVPVEPTPVELVEIIK